MTPKRLQKRVHQVSHPLGKKLLYLMAEKKSNLTFSADVDSCTELLTLARRLGPHICILKTHVDCLSDFTPRAMHELARISEDHRFLIFEDRKFADIGYTAARQYGEGIYKIAKWAHLINAHALPGGGLIKSLKNIADEHEDRGLLLLANMSTDDSLFNETYQKEVLRMADQHCDFVCGFIAPGLVKTRPSFLNFHPGVNLNLKGDSFGQSYRTPESMQNALVDSFIVGRGILQAKNPQLATIDYQKRCWQACTDV